MSISERIRDIIKERKLQDQEFASLIDMSKATLSQRFNLKNWTVDELIQISEVTGYSLSWMLEGFGPRLMSDHVQAIENFNKDTQVSPKPYKSVETKGSRIEEATVQLLQGKNIRPITVTVDRSGNELISYVPVKAQAGYMRGYGDSHFIEKLPAFSLPIIESKGTLRMFQVNGDSMLQLGGGGLHDGDVVVAQYVEDIFSLKDNRVYVVVSTDGVAVKRVINRLATGDKVLILKSDNKAKNGAEEVYRNRVLQPNEILEVWELKAFISRQLNFATDLWDVINDLQASQAILAERVDKIEGPRKLNHKKE